MTDEPRVSRQGRAPSGASPWQDALRRLRRNRVAMLGLVILATFGLASLAAPWLAPYAYDKTNLPYGAKPPTRMHPLGTDELGRDLCARTIHGARVSLAVGVAAVTIGGLIGITLGVTGGYFGGRLDDVIMRLADVQLAFPFILLAILVLVILGSGVINLVIILAVGQWVVYARIARGETIAQKRKDYVDSARAVGVNHRRILWRGILPNILAPLIVIASFNVAAVILSEAALSFLGLGVPPEVPTWGGMLAESRDQLLGGFWWLALFPGLAIMFTVLSLNILGDWLRDFLDPRLRGR